MNRLSTPFGLVCAALLLQGCDCKSGEAISDCIFNQSSARSANVFYYNQITDGGGSDRSRVTTDLLAGTTARAVVSNRSYSGTSNVGSDDVSLSSDPDSVAFTVRRSSDDSELISNTLEQLTDGGDYTFIAMGDLSNPSSLTLQIFRRSSGTPDQGMVRLRFVNALSQLPLSPQSVDIRQDGSLLVEALDYSEVSDSVTLTPSDGRVDVEVRDASNDRIASPGCDVTGGKSYDAILAYRQYNQTDNSDIALFCHPH